MEQHAFVIPAYRHSPFLRECLQSLRTQTVPSPIQISTSTPSPELLKLAKEYEVKITVHSPNLGIGHDWNAALTSVNSRWITLAHQDDIYLPHFAALTKKALTKHPEAALIFSDYAELLGDTTRKWSFMLLAKKGLQEFGFLGRDAISTPRAKRRLLRFGCPIPCPAVTLRSYPTPPHFREDLKVDLDWDTWLDLASSSNSFVRIQQRLLLHRIHRESETSDGIQSRVRHEEDLMIFLRLWPERVARALALMYAMSYQRISK